ncbi:MAG TPA: DegT/DnrJ/EryC1/StrS family aminotransferase [Clostridia bacterium]|nr:DegT/DnrJ/EryC1/StrS family aminotransferase [Clostridia bacterium]
MLGNKEKLAVNGGQPYKTKPFPRWPHSDEREVELVSEVARSGKWWRMTGTMVEEFEEKFAKLHNADYCLCVTNGTHAIELILAAMEIGEGDEVIVPAFTFISTGTAPIYCNATPVFVDVDPVTFCMDPKAFEKAITPKTKAVIPVHIAGHICDMDEINAIAKKHNVKVIEDAAHAHGGEYKGRKAGTLGDAAIFSFQNGKIVTCGEGGAILTNSKELYEKAYLIHGVGRPKGDRIYQHLLLGSNYRMNEFQGAILLAQLERLSEFNQRREKNAALLNSLLSDVKGVVPQGRSEDSTLNTHYMFMFYYDKAQFGGMSRKDFVDALIAEGVPAFIAFPVISNTEFFRENKFRSHLRQHIDADSFVLPNSERIAAEVVWLPHFTLLGDEQDMKEIAGAIKKIQDCTR